MPRYYFDLENGDTAKDEMGVDLPHDLSAKQEAALRALDGTGHQLAHYRGYHTIVVRNEHGHEPYRAKIKRS